MAKLGAFFDWLVTSDTAKTYIFPAIAVLAFSIPTAITRPDGASIFSALTAALSSVFLVTGSIFFIVQTLDKISVKDKLIYEFPGSRIDSDDSLDGSVNITAVQYFLPLNNISNLPIVYEIDDIILEFEGMIERDPKYRSNKAIIPPNSKSIFDFHAIAFKPISENTTTGTVKFTLKYGRKTTKYRYSLSYEIVIRRIPNTNNFDIRSYTK